MPVPLSMQVTVVAATDQGLVRSENQDAVVIGDLDANAELELSRAHQLDVAAGARGPLVIVCDGMGGGEHGTVASDVAARTIWKELSSDRPTSERAVFARQLRRAVRAANVAVRDRAKSLGSKAMGTTAAAAGIVDGALVLALVGDCRAYIFRKDKLTQVTRDQSVVSALVAAGTMTDQEARSASNRHLVLQALGPEPDVDVGLSLVELRRGDRLLLSSDGLHGVLEEPFLIAALTEHSDDEQRALERLFELSHLAGAPDNVSAVLVRFEGEAVSAVGPNDIEPRFTEVDPFAEGDSALTSTSKVGHRLARRAGLRAKVTEAPIPATGTHAVLTVDVEAQTHDRRRIVGPAERLLAKHSSVHWFWLALAVAAIVGLAFGVLR